jgi:hypothetical protein
MLFLQYNQYIILYAEIMQFFFVLVVVKGPTADSMDAPQPCGLLCNLVMKMMFFCFSM